MSYARLQEGFSDVYVYSGGTNWSCSSCKLANHDTLDFATIDGILGHLQEHVKAGHLVPAYAIDTLTEERDTGLNVFGRKSGESLMESMMKDGNLEPDGHGGYRHTWSNNWSNDGVKLLGGSGQ